MAITNRERLDRALQLLASGLQPFIEQQMNAKYGEKWAAEVQAKLPEWQQAKGAASLTQDPQVILALMGNEWQNVFGKILGRTERNLISELREVRNQWAHGGNFGSRDTLRALDSLERLLRSASAGEQADEVERMYRDLNATVMDEQRRSKMRFASLQPTEGSPLEGLKPWRLVATPHQDVTSGKYQQAEFAADLWQVFQGEGTPEYCDPSEFFKRTFLTQGLTQLLVHGVERLSGLGGDPVVQLQTNFGGGKTHAMLALFHLFSGTDAGKLLGIEDVLHEKKLKLPKNVKRAVFVGTQVGPRQEHKKPDGTVVRTIWGEIAWQLGGKEGYAFVADSDRSSTNPGAGLKKLFDKFGPCLILIDEWVAYARQLPDDPGLPAGTSDTQFTFAQTITEAAKAAKNTLLVVSIPASEQAQSREESGEDIEIGGERGQRALQKLRNAIGRIESSWRPANTDEGFEIVRRRLFGPLNAEQSRERDAVARAFVEFYREHAREFPSECREPGYEKRIQLAYPIHPELFDQLHNTWSTLARFQRTRGVLRLMAAVIHALWEREDGNLLILPGTVPFDDSRVQSEITRYLDDNWVPVIDKDVDGPNARPVEIDRERPNLGRYSATRRVARTVFLGTAPTLKAANKGIDDAHVILGCVQPGETTTTFGDALRKLESAATYLYNDGGKHWYDVQQSITRQAEERAAQFRDEEVDEEICVQIRKEGANHAQFARVHVCPLSGDVPDEREARLVMLHPNAAHTGNGNDSAAIHTATEILENRGTIPRQYRNTLVFLAADSGRLKELQPSVRKLLAWKWISEEIISLNLNPAQTKIAENQLRNAEQSVHHQLHETYIWMLIPAQKDAQKPYEWVRQKIRGQDSLADSVVRKLSNDSLLYPQMGGAYLRQQLDRFDLWRGKDNLSVRQIAEDFACYLYLPRLQNEGVLLEAISGGLNSVTWNPDTFAYAEQWDEKKKRYVGLQCGSRLVSSMSGLLVRPEAAAAQLKQERDPEAEPSTEGPTASAPVIEEPGETHHQPKRRFHGSIVIDDPLRLGSRSGQIADEILRHLTAPGAEVLLTIEVSATQEKGFSDETIRTVQENCRTLKFNAAEFEES